MNAQAIVGWLQRAPLDGPDSATLLGHIEKVAVVPVVSSLPVSHACCSLLGSATAQGCMSIAKTLRDVLAVVRCTCDLLSDGVTVTLKQSCVCTVVVYPCTDNAPGWG